ncbi:superoxide dismutase [Iodidimonas sp. SYSU 1G8]|uniref:superoxide dismutase n=1 Tax=Iodidimonas sp. SYSU 1G8 TaxID=3133967 RepID=UPI0031FF1AEE
MNPKMLAVSLSLAFAAAVPFGVMAAETAATTAPSAAFEQAPLPYAFDALEPVIDRQTMEIHHGRHHAAYVKALNAAITDTPALQGKTLDEILASVSSASPAVRNNAGGHYNHTLFWTLMAPADQRGAPSDALKAQIDKDFGSWDNFSKAFEEAGTKRFGSGWAWLIWSDGKLRVISTPNQDNPLMDIAEVKGTPILANDVWEHAYYLKYQNKRADYLKAWWQVVNWAKVNELFAAATE